MAKKTGIDAAARQAMTAGPAPGGGDPDQPALFPEVAEEMAAKSAGRPEGATSKRTRDFLDYLDRMPKLELPGVWLAKRYSSKVPVILLEAGLEDTDENRRWADGQRQDAAKALAPYVHERRPQAVEVDDRRSMSVTVRALDIDGNEIVTLGADGGEMNLGHLLLPHVPEENGDE